MSYFWYDEDPEGMEPADVVDRADYDTVVTERDELVVERDRLVSQRDELLTRSEEAERGWRESKNKYADAFITSQDRIKREQAHDVRKDGAIQTFEEMWGYRGEYGTY